MASEHVDVSVLIPVLNEEQHVREAVASMRAQRFDGTVELVFIDGASTDRTRSILEELARSDDRVRVLDNPARRTPNGLNVGLRASRGEFVARMDAHTLYPPDYLARGVERLRRGDVAHVSGPQIARGEGTWSRRVALALDSKLGTGGVGFRHASGGEIEVDSGFTGVWRRSTLDRYGGWDEGWPQNQDAELAARIRDDGGRLVCVPQMAAEYVPRDSLRLLARQYWRYGMYRAKTSGRHPDSMRRTHLLAPGVALCAVGALLPGRPGRAARAGLLVYALALAGAGAGAARSASGSDAAAVPVVLAVMHLSWGFGFLAGSARFGPPLRALARLAR
ncbi:MAG TPA: glycosyltransferase family 2 protein [Thermoleophilaceae bacterium]